MINRKTKQFLSLLFLLMLFGPISYGQEFLKSLRESSSGLTIADYQKAFYEWSQDKDLNGIKGWKQYKRWEEFNSQRLSPPGAQSGPTIFAQEAIKFANYKNSRNQDTQDHQPSWTPIGPSVFGTDGNPRAEPGLHRLNTIAFHPTDPNTFWVGVAQGGVWKTTNHGESYVSLTDDLPMLRISDIAVAESNTDVLYISVGDYGYIGWGLTTNDQKRPTHYGLGVFKSIDGGETWQPTNLAFQQTNFDGSLTRRVFIHPDDPDHVVAASTTGIWKSTDGGDNWTQNHNELMWDIEQDPTNFNVLYASTGFVNNLQQGNAGLLKSTDFGDTWTPLEIDIPAQNAAQRLEISISPSNPDYVYVVACNTIGGGGLYGFYRSTDGGASWELRANSPNILTQLDGTGGASGGGATSLAIMTHPTDPDKVYVGGLNMWGSDDGGLTWNGISNWTNDYGPSLHADQHYYTFNPLTNLYYILNDGGLYTTDNVQLGSWESALNEEGYTWPTQWNKLSEGINATSSYRVTLSKSDPGFLTTGTQDNSTFIYNKTEWLKGGGGDGMDGLIHPTNTDIIIASYQRGFLSKSVDGGATFASNITANITNQEVGAWTVPIVQHPEDNETIYAAWGNLWKSPDFGDTWEQISIFPNIPGATVPVPISALAISKYDPNIMVISKRPFASFSSQMQLLMTKDGGRTWNNIRGSLSNAAFVTSIALDNDNPDKIWVTISGFNPGRKVYYSDDAGISWQNISDNLPNIPVNTIVHVDGSFENFVYVGTDLGVFYRNDEMSQWEIYGHDLPNVIVNELEIQYESNKLYAATFGRGVWEISLLEYTEGSEVITSIEKNQIKDLQLGVFPNPSENEFHLTMNNLKVPSAYFEIIDVMGRKVYTEDLQFQGQTFNKDYRLGLKYGLYYLKISHGKFSRSVKLLVK